MMYLPLLLALRISSLVAAGYQSIRISKGHWENRRLMKNCIGIERLRERSDNFFEDDRNLLLGFQKIEQILKELVNEINMQNPKLNLQEPVLHLFSGLETLDFPANVAAHTTLHGLCATERFLLWAYDSSQGRNNENYERASDQEIKALLAHEIGHLIYQHPQISFALDLTQITVEISLSILPFICSSLLIPAVILITLIVGDYLCSIMKAALSRKFESDADHFSGTHTDPKAMIGVLQKLEGKAQHPYHNTNHTPSFFHTLHDFHPSQEQREIALLKLHVLSAN